MFYSLLIHVGGKALIEWEQFELCKSALIVESLETDCYCSRLKIVRNRIVLVEACSAASVPPPLLAIGFFESEAPVCHFGWLPG